MEKIIITKEQYNHLVELLNYLPIKNADNIQENTAQNLISAKYLLEEMTEKIEVLKDAIDDFEDAIYDHDLEEMINKMTNYTHVVRELKNDAEIAEDYISGSITRFVEATTLSDFTVIVSEDQIREAIDRNLTDTRVMSVGYKDGEYALLFGEDEDTIDIEPFVFAKGREECYDQARKFIESFLDLEEV